METIRDGCLAHIMTSGELPSSAWLKDHIAQAIHYAASHDAMVGLLFLKLNVAHHDEAFNKAIITRLKKCLRYLDVVFQLGDDEFLLVLAHCENQNNIKITAKNVLKALKQTLIQVEGRTVTFSVNIGISHYPKHSDDVNELIRCADAAMSLSQESGGDNYKVYNEEVSVEPCEEHALEKDIREALVRNEFRLLYQPILSIRTRQITGLEALTRWEHPILGCLEAKEFIGTAEKTGLVVALGKWVLENACEQSKKWMQAGLPAIQISINVSLCQLEQSDFVDNVKKVLKQHHFPAELLTFEMPSDVIAREDLYPVIAELKDLRITMAIDNVAIEKLSLISLQKLSVNKIKLGPASVRQCIERIDVIGEVLAIANKLKMQVVVTGVETKRELEFFQVSQCKEVQGFYFSRPLAEEPCTHYLQERFGCLQASEKFDHSL